VSQQIYSDDDDLPGDGSGLVTASGHHVEEIE
jgi:hypothetical protein